MNQYKKAKIEVVAQNGLSWSDIVLPTHDLLFKRRVPPLRDSDGNLWPSSRPSGSTPYAFRRPFFGAVTKESRPCPCPEYQAQDHGVQHEWSWPPRMTPEARPATSQFTSSIRSQLSSNRWPVYASNVTLAAGSNFGALDRDDILALPSGSGCRRARLLSLEEGESGEGAQQI